MAAEQIGGNLDTQRLERYHQIRRMGEFPTPLSISGVILGTFLPMAGCNLAGRESNLLVDLALGAGAGLAGYLYDRRRARQEMAQFTNQQTQTPNVKR